MHIMAILSHNSGNIQAKHPEYLVISEWVAGGGEVHDLVEPVDSLHPTQVAQALITKQVYVDITRVEHPNFGHPSLTEDIYLSS